MITLNGQLPTKTTDEGKFILKELEEIKKEKNIVIFQDSRIRNKNRKKILSATGRVMGTAKCPSIMIPNTDHMVINGTHRKEIRDLNLSPVSIAFTKKLASVQKDGIVDIKKEKYLFQDFIVLNPQVRIDAENIFFLRYASSIVRRNEIFEFKEEEEDKKKVTEMIGDSEVRYNIFVTLHPDKGMNGNSEPLKQIAASWNVRNADELSIDKLCISLFDAVMDSEKNKVKTKRGIREFIVDVHNIISGNYDIIKLRADLQKAVDGKIITFDNARCVFMKESPIEKELFRVNAGEIKLIFERLVYHVTNNSHDKELIFAELTGLSAEMNMLIQEITDMTDDDKIREIALDREISLQGAPKTETVKAKIIADIKEKGR